MGPQILKRFYSCTIEASLPDMATVARTAQYITGAKLPAIQELYTRQCQKKAQKMVKDSSHPTHKLFSLRSAKSRSKRLLYSFYPQVVRL